LIKTMNNSIFYTDIEQGLSPKGTVPEEDSEMNKYTAGIILGILSAGLTLEAQAVEQGLSPQEAEHPPLRYGGVPTSSKGTDPKFYEYNLQGPSTIESESIQTQGTIKSISAYYEFEGEVRLEVSANAGTAYTKIINGSILKDGFIPGNYLRFRVTVAKDSILKKIIIGYTDSSGVSTMYRNPELKNYKYHKEIYITGGSEEVFNYPLKVELGSNLDPRTQLALSNSQNLEPNIYFTSSDGQTPLYYCYEDRTQLALSNSQNLEPKTQSALYYVKISQIPKEGTSIYIYYGENPEPRTQSALGDSQNPEPRTHNSFNDPTKVFLFFDDFSGTILNEEKWKVAIGIKKEYNIKDGNLALKDCMIISRDFKIKQGIIEFKAKAENNASVQAIIRGSDTKQGYLPVEQMVYSSAYPGAEHTIAINNLAKLNIGKPIEPLTYYIYKVTLNQSGIIFERYSANYKKEAEIQFLDVGNLNEGYIGLKADAAPFNAGSVYYDWVRVRPYLDVEPTVTSLSEKGLSLDKR